MALFFADLVREACRGEGAGDLPLDGALPGHRSFADAVPPGARFHYAICGVTHPDQWETGEGEIVDGALARDPIASSADGAAVDFAAGLKTVALTVSAEWFAARDGGVAAIGDISGLEAALAAKAATAHHHDAAYQPLDSDLSAIAALATTAFGRALLALADAAAARAGLGLGSAAVRNIGTSGDAVPLLGGGATNWAAGASFGGPLTTAGTLRVEGAGGIAIGSVGGVNRIDHNGSHFRFLSAANALGAISAADVLASGICALGDHLAIGGHQVAGPRRTGWAAASGGAARGSFDTASVTTEALAQRVKALIDDLMAHGLIGG